MPHSLNPSLHLDSLLADHATGLTATWAKLHLGTARELLPELTQREVVQKARTFLQIASAAYARGAPLIHLDDERWEELRAFLSDLSREAARMSGTIQDAARFIMTLKDPAIGRLRELHGEASDALVSDVRLVSKLIDESGLFVMVRYLREREEVIHRQREEMMELATPVAEVWDEVLALPVIGTLDSRRAATMTETLLEEIVRTRARVAILDIAGVPTVDTQVGQHLLKAVAAVRLLGAECIASGVRPPIAVTLVNLGVDLRGITTRSTMSDALKAALKWLREEPVVMLGNVAKASSPKFPSVGPQ